MALQLRGKRAKASAVHRSTVVLVAENQLVASIVTHVASSQSSAFSQPSQLFVGSSVYASRLSPRAYSVASALVRPAKHQ